MKCRVLGGIGCCCLGHMASRTYVQILYKLASRLICLVGRRLACWGAALNTMGSRIINTLKNEIEVGE